MKRVAVIIVDWNGVMVTRECLRSLESVSQSVNYAIEVILVDNGSIIPIEPLLCDEFPSVKYFRLNKNLGFAGGNNVGINYAINNKFDYSVLLNNDTTVKPDFLNHLFDFMELNNQVGVTQPKIFFHHDKSKLWNAGNTFNKWLGIFASHGYGKKDTGKYNEVKEMSWSTGCCMMIKNKLFTHSGLGLLNEKYETYYEDVEFSFRVRDLGFLIYYIPDSIIYHIAGFSVKNNKESSEGNTHPFIVYLHSRNRILLLKKITCWFCWPTVILFQSAYFFLLLLRFALLLRPQKFKYVLRAIIDGIFNLRSSRNISSLNMMN